MAAGDAQHFLVGVPAAQIGQPVHGLGLLHLQRHRFDEFAVDPGAFRWQRALQHLAQARRAGGAAQLADEGQRDEAALRVLARGRLGFLTQGRHHALRLPGAAHQRGTHGLLFVHARGGGEVDEFTRSRGGERRRCARLEIALGGAGVRRRGLTRGGCIINPLGGRGRGRQGGDQGRHQRSAKHAQGLSQHRSSLPQGKRKPRAAAAAPRAAPAPTDAAPATGPPRARRMAVTPPLRRRDRDGGGLSRRGTRCGRRLLATNAPSLASTHCAEKWDVYPAELS